jgi:Fe-S cluster assembly protein SufD
MTTTATTREAFLAAFGALERANGAAGPSWLRDVRRGAIERFAERGLPTTRDEDWKYTSLAPVLATGFDLAGDGTTRELRAEDIAPFRVGAPAWSRLVFVNGRYSATLSSLPPAPDGVRIGGLGSALATDPEALRARLAAAAPAEVADAFAALNGAFWRDGVFLHVPADVRLEMPVHALFVSTGGRPAGLHHPRSLILLERGSGATVLESHVSLGAEAGWTNSMSDVVLGPGARLDHYKVGLESPRAFHIARMEARQERDSRLASWSIAFGGRLARNDVHVILGAELAGCTLNGLSVLGGRQHVDTRTDVDHAAPRATSRQLFKGILDGRARGVFNGRVVVRPGANGTDAHQTNKNLLLAEGVEVDSKPQLEIFADDVKCSHGAADGQLGAEAIFYLKSRGLDEEAARALLAYGFANEVLAGIPVEPIRTWLERVLAARLQGGRVAEEETS